MKHVSPEASWRWAPVVVSPVSAPLDARSESPQLDNNRGIRRKPLARRPRWVLVEIIVLVLAYAAHAAPLMKRAHL